MKPAERLRWREVRSTTPFRLTVLLGGLFLTALWATLGFSYVLTAHELTARSDRILFSRARDLLAEDPAHLPARIQSEIANAAVGVSYFALESRDGGFLVGNIRLTARTMVGQPFSVEAKAGAHGPLRLLTVRTNTGEIIVLGRDISQIRDLRERLLAILVVSGVLGTIVVLVAAVLLSRAPLRRVRALERTSRAIAAGDFASRMPIAGRHDELDQFAATVNVMLDEVAHVVAQVKTATDAIAHDLRTPLGRVRAGLADLADSEDVAPPHAAVVDQAVAELDAVIARFGALLRISELEASGRRAGLAPLDLPPLVAQLVELYEPLAEEKGVGLAIEADAAPRVEADRELLFEAIGNLIDNAIKFACTRVVLRIGQQNGQAVLEVVDDGPGIPPEEREAVVRRFHRAEGAAGVEGTGLGLAVVSAIVHLHGFRLELDDAAPGLIARLRMGATAP